MKELHWSLQDLQKLHVVSKEAEIIFPEFFMIVKTRFSRESIFETKYMPGFQMFYETTNVAARCTEFS